MKTNSTATVRLDRTGKVVSTTSDCESRSQKRDLGHPAAVEASVSAVAPSELQPAPPEVLFDRIRRRGAEHPPIAKAALSEWLEKFEAPTPEEMALFDKPVIEDLGPWHT